MFLDPGPVLGPLISLIQSSPQPQEVEVLLAAFYRWGDRGSSGLFELMLSSILSHGDSRVRGSELSPHEGLVPLNPCSSGLAATICRAWDRMALCHGFPESQGFASCGGRGGTPSPGLFPGSEFVCTLFLCYRGQDSLSLGSGSLRSTQPPLFL